MEAELYEWIALRRVTGGGVASKAGRWFDAGRRVPGYVATTLAVLHEAGLIIVLDPDSCGMARTALTDAGRARYAQLSNTPHPLHVPDLPVR